VQVCQQKDAESRRAAHLPPAFWCAGNICCSVPSQTA
jgi:hypothetical protein